MWLIDGQKLKVDFSIDGEHGQYFYLLRIQRFKDYYGNLKLPPWWDGIKTSAVVVIRIAMCVSCTTN
jgi:hypothetical protein